MMRAAVIINPAAADAPDLRERVEQTLAAAGWSSPMWLETTPEAWPKPPSRRACSSS